MKFLPLFFLIVSLPLLAQEETQPLDANAGAPPQRPCSGEAYRQFDFWLGHWSVTTGGQPAGENRIESLHGGCVLAENWKSAQGAFSGSSLNLYDAANEKWHQTWADSSGTLLQLDGGFHDGRMVLEGVRPGADGSEVTHRISWNPNEDGTVRQLWETRTGGDEWTTLFDGLYTKKAD